MTTFDDRKDAFEKKHAHDEELAFKAVARRNKLLGQWAGALLGKADINGTGTTLADVLHGNAGDNILKGKAGMDHLYGHKGNDRLFGGGDADWFYFSTGDGKDRVMDYVDGSDQLHLEGWNAITSLADLKNNHASNQGGNLLIEAGGDSLLVLGIQKADLDVGDVYF